MTSSTTCICGAMRLKCDIGISTSDLDLDPEQNEIQISENSKREYLLAQIRQKDAIIESLLKQVCGSLLYCLSTFFFGFVFLA